MSSTSKYCIGLALIAVILCCLGWANYLRLRISVALAEEQVRYFQEAVQAASQTVQPKEVLDYVEAIKNYFPSGSKQKPGSHLDLIVENARDQATDRLMQLHDELLKRGKTNQ